MHSIRCDLIQLIAEETIYSMRRFSHRRTGQVTRLRKPSWYTVASDHDWYSVTLYCATCGSCRRGSACRYDCLVSAIVPMFFSLLLRHDSAKRRRVFRGLIASKSYVTHQNSLMIGTSFNPWAVD